MQMVVIWPPKGLQPAALGPQVIVWGLFLWGLKERGAGHSLSGFLFSLID